MRNLLALAFTLLAATAFAQEGPDGIGFAQAEEGAYWCQAPSAAEALACARDECEAEAGGQDCFETAWCLPARWSGLMTVWSGDFHSTQVVCGAPNEAALAEIFRAWCAGIEDAQSCDFSIAIDPDGNERDDVGESFEGPAAQ